MLSYRLSKLCVLGEGEIANAIKEDVENTRGSYEI
jgi:hypothetical protein